MQPELSILINSYKNPQLLDLCISSIQKNVRGIEYEIVVANGETEEETFDLMREKYPSVCFIPNKHNVGCGRLVNQTLGVAKGRFFFIINSDIIIKDDSVNLLLDFVKGDESVGVAGPKLINFDNSVQDSCFKFYSPWTILYRRTFLGRFSFAKKKLEEFLMKKERLEKPNQPIEADWIMGSAMMMRRSAVEKVGPMDGRFFMYFEDVDWCWRFWAKGYKIFYYPLARVFHYHGKQSFGGGILNSIMFNKYARVHIKSGIKFFLKHFGEKNPHSSK